MSEFEIAAWLATCSDDASGLHGSWKLEAVAGAAGEQGGGSTGQPTSQLRDFFGGSGPAQRLKRKVGVAARDVIAPIDRRSQSSGALPWERSRRTQISTSFRFLADNRFFPALSACVGPHLAHTAWPLERRCSYPPGWVLGGSDRSARISRTKSSGRNRPARSRLCPAGIRQPAKNADSGWAAGNM